MYEWVELWDMDDATRQLLRRQRAEAEVQAAKDALTTSTTDFKALRSVLPIEQPAQSKPTITLIQTPYGTISEHYKLSMRNLDETLAICAKCTGSCLLKQALNRETNLYSQPTVDGIVDFQPIIRWKRCKFGHQRRLNESLHSARIPQRYVGKTLADYEVDKLNQKAVDYARNALTCEHGAYLFGEVGTGKTFLASIIAQQFVQAGHKVIFVNVPELLGDLQVALFDKKTDSTKLFDTLRTCTLLVLDDLGMEKSTQWVGTTLCKIINSRYESAAKTLVTSNLSLDELADKLNNATDGANFNGDRLVDRLKEMTAPIVLKGFSRRHL